MRKAFEPGPVSTLDAYRTIHREAAVVRPGAHFGSVIAVDQTALDEGAQDTGSIEDARAHCRAFFTWYNTQHRHSGIGFMTPETVHLGRAADLTRQRSITLDAAFLAHPERFKYVAPSPPEVPTAAWINPPKKKVTTPADPSTLAL